MPPIFSTAYLRHRLIKTFPIPHNTTESAILSDFYSSYVWLMWLFVLIILTDKIHLVSQQQAGTLHRQEEDLSGSGG
jgi:hypothetical protein